MEPLHVLKCSEGFLNTDDVRSVKGFHFADPDHGGVGGEHMRVVLADFFERRIVLRSYVTVVQIVIVQDDIYYFLCDAVVVSVPLDLDIEIELPVSASGEFEDFIQSGDLRPRKVRTEERAVVEVFDLVVSD